MTRKLLNDSLLECLQHKLPDKVTVTEICRRADVNQISGVQFWEKLSIPAIYFLQGLGSEQEEAEIERSTFAFSGIYALLFGGSARKNLLTAACWNRILLICRELCIRRQTEVRPIKFGRKNSQPVSGLANVL